VLSRTGKEAVVARDPATSSARAVSRDSRAGWRPRLALSASTVLVIEKNQMLEMIHSEPAVAERFMTHMLARNIRIEEDLIDQLFNSSEKRLARVACCWRATARTISR
jgi:CRP/FNR family cyclic AMP-dependent transcriptional regulator